MRANGEPMRASSAARTMSHAKAIPRPTPRQAPCTAAIVGTSRSASRCSSGLNRSLRIASASSVSGSASVRSRPAENARPAAVTSTARASPTESSARWKSATISASSEFKRSGRSRRNSATPSSIVHVTVMSAPSKKTPTIDGDRARTLRGAIGDAALHADIRSTRCPRHLPDGDGSGQRQVSRGPRPRRADLAPRQPRRLLPADRAVPARQRHRADQLPVPAPRRPGRLCVHRRGLRSLVSGGREEIDAGMAQAVAAYKQLEARCDLVVIEGTDFTGPSSPWSSTSTPASPATSARRWSPSSTATTALATSSRRCGSARSRWSARRHRPGPDRQPGPAEGARRGRLPPCRRAGTAPPGGRSPRTTPCGTRRWPSSATPSARR